ncbi:hypothetical protein B0T26DRAFT_732244 [Lasiosphaeria miniovina]|uniref:Uncharacterized protein n=1 Tax=Lasiosphaeria miniovina TaxID=1954250 RepID=A0AA39ZU66_9PEZI|nr:uncharacterized protein B0T26DRAFT_732244 [Lasiosphaeria miniovina]KAK0703677.1 hypothetical protein B0T26DRAFT_732244 [Lasiosphaeria miniovina]
MSATTSLVFEYLFGLAMIFRIANRCRCCESGLDSGKIESIVWPAIPGLERC